MSFPQRLSGSSSSPSYWRMYFHKPPTVLLDDRIVTENIYELLAGNGGYIVVEVLGDDGKPVLADVVLPSGEVIDRVIAKRTLYGRVEIVPLPERFS